MFALKTATGRWLAWIPLPVFAATLLALFFVGGRTVYESPALLITLNIFFSTVAALVVAYLCMCSFQTKAEPSLLLLGCGVLVWGASCGVAAGAVRYSGNITVTIHNLGVWLSALLSLSAAVLAIRAQPASALRAPAPWTAAACLLGLATVAFVTVAAYEGWLPVFFVQGRGGTPVRQLVLGSAIGMFLATSALLAHMHMRQPSRFHYWYALGLALLALGLAGVMMEPVHGGLLSWTGRAAQYAGSVYLLVAGLAAVRDAHGWRLSLAASLHESQGRLASFAAATFEGIVESENGRIVDCNDQFAQMLGFEASELRGKPIEELLSNSDRARVMANIEANRESVTEHELQRKDGSALVVEAHGKPCTFDRHRRFTALRDITARKRAEDALRWNVASNALLSDIASRLLANKDPGGLIESLCAPAAAHLGCEVFLNYMFEARSGELRLNAFGGIPREAADRMMRLDLDSTLCGISVRDGIRVLAENLASSKEPRAARVQSLGIQAFCCHPLTIKGEVLGTLSFGSRSHAHLTLEQLDFMKAVSDLVTTALNRFRTEDALHDKDARLQLTQEGGDAGIWEWNILNDTVSWSPALAQLYGLPADGTTTQADWAGRVHPDDLNRVVAERDAAIAAHRPFHVEFRIRLPSGEERWVSSRGRADYDANGRPVRVIGTNRNISLRKRAEAAQQRSEFKYKVLFETSRDAIMTLEPPSWHFTSGNPATLAMFGARDEAEFVTLGPCDLSPETQPDGRASSEKAEAMVETAMREGANFFEWTHRRLSGEDFPCTVLLTRLELGGQKLLQATVRDITAQKAAEKALLASEEAKFSALFHGSAEGILLADPETRQFTLSNEAVCQMLGYSAEELAAMRADDIHPLESRAETLAKFERCRQGALASVSELPVLRKDGSIFFADLTVTPITVAGKNYLAGFFRDVTERKLAQETLAADAIRRRVLVEQSRDGIVILDQNGKVYEANRRYAEMLGYTADEIRDLYVWDWEAVWNQAQLLEMIDRVGESGDHFETRHRRKDGAVLDVEVSTNAAVLEGQKLIFCVCRDITARKRSEQRLAALNRCLLTFGSEPIDNINGLVALLGEQLGAACALYNRLEGHHLCAMGCWHVPDDFSREDQAEGHICYDVIRAGLAQPTVLRDLAHTRYAQTDPCVSRYGLKTYVGQAVSLEGRSVGSLCVVYQEDRAPTPDELSLLGIVASAVGVEEKRLQAERTLRASEERFRSTVHAAMDGFWRADLQGRLLEVNEAYCQMSGYSEAELLTMTIAKIEAHESADEVTAHSRTIAERSHDRFETRHRRKDGSLFEVEVSAQYKPDEGGYTVAFLRDITDRKEAEQSLRYSHSLLEATLDSTADGLLVVDTNGKVSSYNQRFLSLWGIPAALAQNGDDRLLLDFVLNQVSDPDAFVAKVKELYQMPAACSWDEISFKDGRVFERYSCPQKCDQRIVGRVWSFRDITALKRAEVELRRLAQVVEQTDEIITVTDNAFSVVYVNPAFERVTGFSREDARAASFWANKMNQQEDGVLAQMRETLGRGEMWRGRLAISRKAGAHFVADAIISPIRDAEGRVTHYVTTERDLTREQELELQVLQSQKMEAVGRLAGGVAHDFNNLLQSILGYCELLQPRLATSPVDSEDLLEIQKSARRAADLTGQLLAFSRKQLISPALADLNVLVDGMQKMLRRIIGEDIHFALDLAERLPAVKVDVGQFHQVVMNLAVNARDAMPGGGRLSISTDCVTLSDELAHTIPDARSGTFVRLSVSDTGVGMSEAVMAQIFEPFFTTKGLGKGSGLGLSVIYGIVRQHEGWINVYSEEGRGSTFKVYLPAAGSAAESGDPGTPPQAPRGRGERILLIEDEPGVRNLAARFLRDAGYDVVTADSAAQGEAAFARESGHFDLLFCDVVLPDQNGLVVAEKLLLQKTEMPVLFSTGYTDERACWHAIEHRRYRYLLKPYVKSDLLRAVRELLDAQAESARMSP